MQLKELLRSSDCPQSASTRAIEQQLPRNRTERLARWKRQMRASVANSNWLAKHRRRHVLLCFR